MPSWAPTRLPRLRTGTTPCAGGGRNRAGHLQEGGFLRSSWPMSRREAYEPQSRCCGGSRRSLTWRLRARPWRPPRGGAGRRMLSPMARTFAPNAARDWTPWCAGTCEILLPCAVFAEPTNTDQVRQDYRGVWFKLSREGHYFEMNEPNRARTARKLGGNVVAPLLLKGDRIRLKDGTRLFYGEGFDSESEPGVGEVPDEPTEPIPTYGGGRRGTQMCDDPDEQEQVRIEAPRARLACERACHSAEGGAAKEGRPQQGAQHFGAGAYPSEAALWPTGRGAAAVSSIPLERPRPSRLPSHRVQPRAVLQLGFLGVLFLQRGQSPRSRVLYQPSGGPHEGARCSGTRAAGSRARTTTSSRGPPQRHGGRLAGAAAAPTSALPAADADVSMAAAVASTASAGRSRARFSRRSGPISAKTSV